MAKLTAARTAQNVVESEFVFNFDDTMVNTSGVEVDFGSSNTAATSFDIINLPQGAVVIGGEVVTDTAFDAATYNVTLGDSASAARYLASTDKKGAGRTAITPTGHRGDGENLRLGVTPADACTQGKLTVRVQYIITGRACDTVPN